MEEAQLKQLAAQLRQPGGDRGVEVADMMHESNIGMTMHAVNHLQLSNNDAVLELGHGNCGHLPWLMEQATDIVYYGIELSELMNQEATEKNRLFVEQQQAIFSLYDGKMLPFDNGGFDKAFTVNTIYFWEKPLDLLEEIYRVLKPGGRLSIGFAQQSFMQQLPFTRYGFTLYSTENIEKLVRLSSFEIVGFNHQKETVRSKMGQTVEREFCTLILSKQ